MFHFFTEEEFLNLETPNYELLINSPIDFNELLNSTLQKENVLLVGQVQSGKTNFIIEIIKEAFNVYKFDFVILLGGTNNKLLEQTKSRIKKENIYILNKEHIEQINKVNSGTICVLKEVKNLEKVFELLKNKNNKKVLLIDDECDFYSINNNIKNNEETKIFQLLQKIKNTNNDVGFLLVTGTPFANILSSKSLNINKIFFLPTNEEYTGLKFFNKQKEVYITNIIKKDKDPHHIILDSLAVYLFKSYEFLERFQNERTQFLINYSDKTEDHQTYKAWILDYINNKKYLIFKKVKDIFKLEDNQIIFENFKRFVCHNLSEENVWILNKDNSETPKKNKLSIIIGGHLLSRGVTFENLLVSLMKQDDLDKDTLLQKCRWFGYRKTNQRYKYMKIIIPEKLKDILLGLEDYIDIFWPSKNGGELNKNAIIEKLHILETKLNSISNKGITSNAKRK